MSFILDAIAKSEQERQQQEVPVAQILALPGGSVQQTRRLLPYFVVGALLLNAAVLVIWIQSGQTLPGWSSTTPSPLENRDGLSEPVIEPDNATTREQATSAEITANAISANHVSSVEVTANTAISEVVVEIDNKVSANESTAEPQGISSTVVHETAAIPESEPETLPPQPVATQTSGDDTAWVRIEPDTLSNKARSGQLAVSAQSEENTSVLWRKISSLSELPGAVRDDLPTVVFSGHLYSSNPNSSVVFVDGGRPVMKGRHILDELILHEITSTGVIVEFRGYLIEVGVLQNWTLN